MAQLKLTARRVHGSQLKARSRLMLTAHGTAGSRLTAHGEAQAQAHGTGFKLHGIFTAWGRVMASSARHIHITVTAWSRVRAGSEGRVKAREEEGLIGLS